MQKNNLFAMLNEVVKVANDDKNYRTYTGATPGTVLRSGRDTDTVHAKSTD